MPKGRKADNDIVAITYVQWDSDVKDIVIYDLRNSKRSPMSFHFVSAPAEGRSTVYKPLFVAREPLSMAVEWRKQVYGGNVAFWNAGSRKKGFENVIFIEHVDDFLRDL